MSENTPNDEPLSQDDLNQATGGVEDDVPEAFPEDVPEATVDPTSAMRTSHRQRHR